MRTASSPPPSSGESVSRFAGHTLPRIHNPSIPSKQGSRLSLAPLPGLALLLPLVLAGLLLGAVLGLGLGLGALVALAALAVLLGLGGLLGPVLALVLGLNGLCLDRVGLVSNRDNHLSIAKGFVLLVVLLLTLDATVDCVATVTAHLGGVLVTNVADFVQIRHFMDDHLERQSTKIPHGA